MFMLEICSMLFNFVVVVCVCGRVCVCVRFVVVADVLFQNQDSV